MEKEEKNSLMMRPPPETELWLQWGNRKRLRCVRIRSNATTSPPLYNHQSHLNSSSASEDLSSDTTNNTTTSTRIRRRITSSRFLSVLSSPDDKQLPTFIQPSSRLTRNSAEPAETVRAPEVRSQRRSPERSYTTRGTVGVVGNCNSGENSGEGKVNNHQVSVVDGHHGGGGGAAAGSSGVRDEHINNNNVNGHNNNGGSRGGGGSVVWPKLYIALSSKEKEEDFMAMKGCKLPQRPKKRAKVIQRTLLLVSPGTWLPDMSLERYEVREKKISKKRPRGLKAMGNFESDSD